MPTPPRCTPTPQASNCWISWHSSNQLRVHGIHKDGCPDGPRPGCPRSALYSHGGGTPILSSERPQCHTAQGPASIQPTPGKPTGGEWLPEDTQHINAPRTLGTLLPPALRPVWGWEALSWRCNSPHHTVQSWRWTGLCPAPRCPRKGESGDEIRPSQAAVGLPEGEPFSNSLQGTLRTSIGSLTGLPAGVGASPPTLSSFRNQRKGGPLGKPWRERTVA